MAVDAQVGELVLLWKEAHRLGLGMSAEDVCRDHPDLLEEVRRRIQALESSGLEATYPSNRHKSTAGTAPYDQAGEPTKPPPSEPSPGQRRPAPPNYQALDPRASGRPANKSLLAPGSEPVPGYVLLERLGKGGFGEVWKAAASGDILVALKFVPLMEGGNAELRALEFTKGIRHPNLIATFGAWQAEGYLVIAMELADCTLLDRFREETSHGLSGIPGPELLEYFQEAAKGIDYLNEPRITREGKEQAGIQHRDIKPQNLMLVGGCVKVADFGLARVLEHSVTGHTGSMTPAYAAPEFLKGSTSRHSDQYSLAITYCQLRGGRLPFAGNQAQIMTGHLMYPPDLTMLPDAERPAVKKALDKVPQGRWPNCRAFVAALAEGVKGHAPPPSKPLAPFETFPETINAASSPSGSLQDFLPTSRRSIAGPLIVIFLLLMIGGGMATWFCWDRGLSATIDELLGRSQAGQGEEPPPTPVKPEGAETKKPEGDPPVLPSKDPPPPVKPVEPPPVVVETAPVVENSIGMKLVRIPAGEFTMGSPSTEPDRGGEEHLHLVKITKPFYMGAYEVTQEQFEKVMLKNPSRFTKAFGGGPTYPVEKVSWYEAAEFCRRLSALASEKEKNRVYRLPSEAQWEYACRAKTSTPYFFGTTLSSSDANFNGAPTGRNLQRTTEVGAFPPNGFGLYDMHGNVFEWVADWHDENYYLQKPPATDPRGPGSGSNKIVRGGGWASAVIRCRSAFRQPYAPDENKQSFIGFRVVFEP